MVWSPIIRPLPLLPNPRLHCQQFAWRTVFSPFPQSTPGRYSRNPCWMSRAINASWESVPFIELQAPHNS